MKRNNLMFVSVWEKVQSFHAKVFVIAFIIFLLPIPFTLFQEHHLSEVNQNTAWISLRQNVSVYKGDVSAGVIPYTAPDPDWQPLYEISDVDKVTGPYWFKLQLPENQWQQPTLYIKRKKVAALYVDDQPIRRSNVSESDKVNMAFHWQMVPLPADFSGQTLYISILLQNESLRPGFITIGDESDLIRQLLVESTYSIVLAIVLGFIAGGALFLYLSRREKIYLYFTLVVLTTCYIALFRSEIVALFWDFPLGAYLLDLALPFGALWLLRIFEELYGPGSYNIHRRLWQGMLLLFVTALVVSLWDATLYQSLTIYIYPIVFAPTLIVVLWTSWHNFVLKKDVTSAWYVAGFFSLAFLIFFYLLFSLRYHHPHFPFRWNVFTQLQRVYFQDDRFLHGVFMLIFSIGMILRERYVQVHRRLAQFNQSLEELVQQRTAELEESNHRYRTSMQETAATLAEISVLEERNRIAQNIHDNAGHALTGAIIQIEAAKYLMSGNPERAAEKLSISLNAVRKGLDQIREALQLMKKEDDEQGLLVSLHQLISETEELAGVKIDFHPSPLPPLGAAQKRVIYHALQEGLTNGIRHGGSTYFTFTLTYENSTLYFQLWNNGSKVDTVHYGFGLSAMKERVESLRGTMNLSSADRYGCTLTIQLPVSYKS